ncbi:DMT family transporter [Chachezhania antarctica]|uniref:DMT family transporter n=1 Tax=Chachezhania antarctica TaxID=2340860 RepID=UPI000EACC7D5|nr:DMT family transporter [Chachezhania antarctica]|tara:strand:+ start:3824 stop:4741 length:918 start_codon:yes stop_codon:yes gene_type:complete
MTPARQHAFLGVLVLLGAGWGATQPLAKISVSTGYGHFGLMFWQAAIGSAFMWILVLLRGRPVPLNARALTFCAFIAMIGTAIPNTTQFMAVKHLPSGIMSILLSLIPMIAFPISLALGLERFALRRFLGLTVGLCGVLILVLPDASLPDPAMLVWIPLAMVAPIFYAFEGNFVSKWGTGGLDPIPLLAGATLITAVLVLPAAIATDQFITPFQPFGAPEWAIVGSAIINVAVYAAYVWLVGQAGAVFAAQVSYLVTGFGVFWAMLVLGERYSPYVWIALVLVLCGIALVQPRKNAALADTSVME